MDSLQNLVDFDDVTARPPHPDCEIPPEWQVQNRISHTCEIEPDRIELFQFPEQRKGEFVACWKVRDYLPYFTPPRDPFPCQLVDFYIDGKAPVSEEWKGKRILCFGRIYRHGRRLMVKGMDCPIIGQPTLVEHRFIEMLGPHDHLAVRLPQGYPPISSCRRAKTMVV